MDKNWREKHEREKRAKRKHLKQEQFWSGTKKIETGNVKKPKSKKRRARPEQDANLRVLYVVQ